MGPLASRIRTGILRLLVGLALLCPGAAAAFEVSAAGAASGFTVHDPGETLRDFCESDGEGRLWLVLPGGARYELVTSTDDPAIANPGDGQFHPFDEAEVRAALAALHYPMASIRADVFLLPFPRRQGLESAAGPELVLLAPGVRPLSREQQHAEFVHELGHVVQYALLPDGDVRGWERYRALRGIADVAVYGPGSAHAFRPHEIFAEDFRALFGGALANYSGTVENATLAYPAEVEGLRSFMLGLADPAGLVRLQAYPNPARGAVRFYRTGLPAARLDLFDLQGRRIASLEPSVAGPIVQWFWNGLDAAGRRVAGSAIYGRVRDEAGSTVRLALVP